MIRVLATVSADDVAKYGAIAKLWALVKHFSSNPTNIPDELRPLWLVWSYDSEVNNGGHLQYFHNRGIEDVPKTLEALRIIGAEHHAKLLETAFAAVKRDPVSRVNSLEEYSVMAQTRSFRVEDSEYYMLPDIGELLVAHNEALLNKLVQVQV